MTFRLPLAAAAAALALGTWAGPAARASTIIAQSAAPAGAVTEIGARIRWGGSGFEASLFDAHSGSLGRINQSPTLNPGGTPVWRPGQAYAFEVSFVGATGTLGLAVDFDRNGSFGPGESITRTLFRAPGPTSYVGEVFEAVWISVRQSGNGSSSLTNLVVNGVAQPSLTPPAGTPAGAFYLPSGGAAPANWTITGQITFAAGAGQENPAWDFKFLNVPPGPGATPSAVPAPAGLAALCIGLLGLAAVRRRG